ncbi:glutamate racemase [Deinococcus sp. KSM4-11]|uniref:glutamate racemase n=1 Tax=Deinococcus sp. KSM4-11 TaxID=2568654 RepID=UPI0010A368D0|nr:glutamate racemase [Deinococcus sp. KSM4-11]THF83576.1 glutamate racemase [Deinococcus sp. KSM4-11]
MSSSAPVGVFDSGVGGLSILAELRRVLPFEDVLYLGDTAHVPYGERSEDDVIDLTERAVAALQARGVKAVVVACNTAAAFSLSRVRSRFPFPVIGLVPAVKPAALATRSGKIAVLATPVTLKGQLMRDVIRDHAAPLGVSVEGVVNLRLVPLVEAGQAGSEETRRELRTTLTPLKDAGVDQLVLGCTHYPFLAPAIRAEFGDTFTLVDSGEGVARHTRHVLEQGGLLRAGQTPGQVTYLVTGDVGAVRPVITTLTAETGHSGEHFTAAAPEPLRIESIHT